MPTLKLKTSDGWVDVSVEIDETLALEGKAADAKAVGDRFASLIKPGAVSVDFSSFDSGTFTETLSDGSRVTYTVTFDENGNPVNINNGESDFAIVWG